MKDAEEIKSTLLKVKSIAILEIEVLIKGQFMETNKENIKDES